MKRPLTTTKDQSTPAFTWFQKCICLLRNLIEHLDRLAQMNNAPGASLYGSLAKLKLGADFDWPGRAQETARNTEFCVATNLNGCDTECLRGLSIALHAEPDHNARNPAIADDEVGAEAQRHHGDCRIEVAEEGLEVGQILGLEQPLRGAARLEPDQRGQRGLCS